MRLGVRLVVCATIMAIATPVTRAQVSLEALSLEFASASETERVALFESRPEIRERPFREVLWARGTEQLRRGEFQAAEHSHRTVLWIAERLDSAALRAIAYIHLASVMGQRGDFAMAQEFAQDALRITEAVNDIPNIQSASANLGIIQRRLGDYDGALQSFNRALSLAEQLGWQDHVARVLNNIGLAYFDLGNFALARDYLDRSVALKLKSDDGGRVTQDLARSLSNIGMLYDEVGDYSQALDHYQRANAMLERSGGGPSLSTTLSNIGHANAGLGNEDTAREYYKRALTVAEGYGDKPRVANLHYLLGRLSRRAGLLAESETIQRKSLVMREEMGESIPLVESLTELSSLALLTRRPAEALSLASRALAIATERRLFTRVWEAQKAVADARAALQQNDEAIAAYQAGIQTIETLRQQTAGGDRARQMYLGQRVGPYYGLARVHAAAGRSYEAFVAIERARARTLLDVIAAGPRANGLLSDEQRRRERALSQAVVSVSSEIDQLLARKKSDPVQLTALEAKLARARLERDAYTTALYESKPDLRIARGDTPVISREDLADLVTPATAIVSLVLDNLEVWAYVVTRGPGGVTVTARTVGMTSTELVELANQFSRQVATRDLGFAVNARKLYDLLFVETKIEGLLKGKSRLIIVPDGPLWRMPFQALQTARDTFLIEERSVSYSPSVSALAALQRRARSRRPRAPHLLALGDPAIEGASDKTSSGRKAAGRLPQAAREVKALGQLYGESRSHVLIAEQATERALIDNLARATVVHVATHGIIDDQSPMYSRVMLAPHMGGGSDADGRLEAWEVMNLPLEVDLAVLSACETARGPVGDGEGVIGLSWSLFAAGASTAVVSQWEVDSASTTALMIAFHERLLLSGKSGGARRDTAEALRVAATRLMRGPAYRHPFYWAGFVVVGAY